MFDLEQAIAEWRRQLTAGGIESRVILDELESHLRAEFIRLEEVGRGGETAFRAAAQAVGEPTALVAEFKLAGEIEAARRVQRFRWSTRFFAVVYALGFGCYFLQSSKFNFADRWIGLAAVIFLAAYLCFGGHVCRWLPVFRKRTRAAIGLAVAAVSNLAVGVFFNAGLPRLDLTEGRLVVVVLWTMTLLAVAGSVWHALEVAAGRQTRQAAG